MSAALNHNYGWAAAVLLGGLACATAQASGQYEVEDAELIDARSCEMEIWHTEFDGSPARGTFISPTCRFNGNVEFTFEAGFERDEDRGRSEAFVLEAKTLFRDIDTFSYGLGLFTSVEYGSERDRFQAAFITGLATLPLWDDRAQVHFNLGMEHDRDEGRRNALTWGLGTEVALVGPTELVAEILGDDRAGRPDAKVGLRWWLFAEALSLDLTYARNLESGADQAYIVGVGFQALTF